MNKALETLIQLIVSGSTLSAKGVMAMMAWVTEQEILRDRSLSEWEWIDQVLHLQFQKAKGLVVGLRE